jgi:hypothetical protein
MKSFRLKRSREASRRLIIRDDGGKPMDINVIEQEIIRGINLTGELDLNDFTNLETLALGSDIGNKITTIKTDKLTKLTQIHLNNCPELTFADFSNCSKLC